MRSCVNHALELLMAIADRLAWHLFALLGAGSTAVSLLLVLNPLRSLIVFPDRLNFLVRQTRVFTKSAKSAFSGIPSSWFEIVLNLGGCLRHESTDHSFRGLLATIVRWHVWGSIQRLIMQRGSVH